MRPTNKSAHALEVSEWAVVSSQGEWVSPVR
jgi:hypothetical protein